MADNSNTASPIPLSASAALVARMQRDSGYCPEPVDENQVNLRNAMELRANMSRRNREPALSAWQKFSVIAPAGKEPENLNIEREAPVSDATTNKAGSLIVQEPKLTCSVFDSVSGQMGPEMLIDDIGPGDQRGGLNIAKNVHGAQEDLHMNIAHPAHDNDPNAGSTGQDSDIVDSAKQSTIFEPSDLRPVRWRDVEVHERTWKLPHDPRMHDNVSLKQVKTDDQASIPSAKVKKSIPSVVRRVLRDLSSAGDAARKLGMDLHSHQAVVSSGVHGPNAMEVTARKLEDDLADQFQDLWQSVSGSLLPHHVAQGVMARPDGPDILKQLSFAQNDSELPSSALTPSLHNTHLRSAQSLQSEDDHDVSANVAEQKMVDDLDEIKAIRAEMLKERYKTLGTKYKQRHALEADLAFSHMSRMSKLSVPMLDTAIQNEDTLIASYKADLEKAKEDTKAKVEARLDKLIRDHQRTLGHAIEQRVDFARYEEEFMELVMEVKHDDGGN